MNASPSVASPASSAGSSAFKILATSADLAALGDVVERAPQLVGGREQPMAPSIRAKRTRLSNFKSRPLLSDRDRLPPFADPRFGERSKTSLRSQSAHDRRETPLQAVHEGGLRRRVNRLRHFRQLAPLLE